MVADNGDRRPPERLDQASPKIATPADVYEGRPVAILGPPRTDQARDAGPAQTGESARGMTMTTSLECDFLQSERAASAIQPPRRGHVRATAGRRSFARVV